MALPRSSDRLQPLQHDHARGPVHLGPQVQQRYAALSPESLVHASLGIGVASILQFPATPYLGLSELSSCACTSRY